MTAEDELRRSLRDMTSLLALPSLCRGCSRAVALERILDTASSFLSCPLVYGRARLGERDVEAMRTPDRVAHAVESADFAAPAPNGAVIAALRDAAEARVADLVAVDVAGTRGVVVPVGFYGDAGVLVLVDDALTLDDHTRLVLRTLASLSAAALENAQLLESVHEANRRKDEFLALLGHELRNPLAPVVTALELLSRREQQPNKLLEVIRRQTQHMIRLVDDLLDISRITRGTLVLAKERVDVRDVVDRARELAAPLLAARGHTLHVDVEQGFIVDADPIRLAQVFANLLSNAARYTPQRGGHVRVHTEDANGRVRIAVADDGRGIAPELLERIFEPFVQANRDKDALTGGLGLGLAIVKTLVELHGGSVSAHSDGPGCGSTFIVELPVVERTHVGDVHALLEGVHEGAGARVLLVDDNEDVAMLLKDALELLGHEVAVAHDAPSALAQLDAFAPSVALVDLNLPGEDGYELAAAIRRRLGDRVRLIALTGFSRDGVRDHGSGARFDMHLVKPVPLQLLRDALLLQTP